MKFSIPTKTETLSSDHKDFLNFFKKSCRQTMLKMLKNSQSGHPGGSLSTLDFLSVLYAFRLTKTDEKIVISNGHISPGIYSVLAECGAIDKEDLIKNFRKIHSCFEGHVTRHVPGIFYGTGPLGVGISVAAGFAKAAKLQKNNQKIFCTIGDGEMQEGQVHEAALFSVKEKLDNLVVFVDWNRVQLSGSLEETLPISPKKFFEGSSWNVLEIDGHDDEQIWKAINFESKNNRPTAIIGKTIMGKGISLMEKDGQNMKSIWHGKVPKPDEIDDILKNDPQVQLTDQEFEILDKFRQEINFHPKVNLPFWEDLEIRLVKESEKDELFDFRYKIIFEKYNIDKQIIHKKNQEDKNFEDFVFLKNNQIIASIRLVYYENYLELKRVSVDQKFQNTGVGAKLMSWAEEKAKEKNIYKIKLNAHEPTKKFYEKFEFQIIKKQDKGISPEQHFLMEKILNIKNINLGNPIEYKKDELTDCRSAYGKALLDLAKNNENILASSADLSSSVMTKFVEKELPDQFIEFGIAEQNMVSVCGGLSLSGFVPFCSTFGAFMSSRAKDQARVNDINHTNVKMVSTHCGLSVGEDGPTHQAIDDMGSFLGMFNTKICEPADPNHCDRIIRFVAKNFGNFYVRMGRAKLPVLQTEKGEIFFDKNYKYYYGRCDVLRSGKKITIVATGATVHEALIAREKFSSPEDIEIVIVSSIKKFDDNLKKSLSKTNKIVVCEDHNPFNGLGSQISLFAAENNISLDFFRTVSVKKYELSGTPAELYKNAKIDSEEIISLIKEGN